MKTIPQTSDETTQLISGVHSKTEIVSLVNEIIDQYYLTSTAKAELLHPRFKILIEVMHELAKAGGKRMRPYLAVATYEAYGGKQFKDMCVVGASLEIIHMAMLIHDDIIDRDFVRYGVDNIAGQYRKLYGELAGEDVEHYASVAALLAGDINLSASYQLILDSNFTPEQKIIAQRLLAETIFRVIGGELIDTESVLYPPGEIDPITVSKIKTAHYSFVTPMLCGAALAGVPEDELQKLTKFGMGIGIAFQIADDILGMFGDEAITGKSTVGDIREGRRTWMAERARELSNTQQKLLLHEFYGNKDVSSEQAEIIRKIFIECGAKKAASDKISELVEESLSLIDELSVSKQAKLMFKELVTSTTRRER